MHDGIYNDESEMGNNNNKESEAISEEFLKGKAERLSVLIDLQALFKQALARKEEEMVEKFKELLKPGK